MQISCAAAVLLLHQAVVEDGSFTAALVEPAIVIVRNLVDGTSERLEFRNAVVKMSLGEACVSLPAVAILVCTAVVQFLQSLAATSALSTHLLPAALLAHKSQFKAQNSITRSFWQPGTKFALMSCNVAAGFGHLVVCTSSHCHVYATTNFNTPHIFDLKEQPQLVLQCGRSFVLLDAAAGLQVGHIYDC
jgi:hypothetical protein